MDDHGLGTRENAHKCQLNLHIVASCTMNVHANRYDNLALKVKSESTCTEYFIDSSMTC